MAAELVDDIKINVGGNWFPAREYQKEAFRMFTNQPHTNDPIRYNKKGYKFTVKREADEFYGGIYLVREDGTKSPIADWNNVKVFLLDIDPVNWYEARNYQTWAYFDFLYSGLDRVSYQSKESEEKGHKEIEIDGLPPGIVFSLSRNDNGSVYYEKNDHGRTRVRISDNKHARSGYMGFYRRMTSDIGMLPVPYPIQNTKKPNIPYGVVGIKTNNEEIMCVVCNDNQQNIVFDPCKHTATCSECYVQLTKIECPLCRQTIVNVGKYDPLG